MPELERKGGLERTATLESGTLRPLWILVKEFQLREWSQQNSWDHSNWPANCFRTNNGFDMQFFSWHAIFLATHGYSKILFKKLSTNKEPTNFQGNTLLPIFFLVGGSHELPRKHVAANFFVRKIRQFPNVDAHSIAWKQRSSMEDRCCQFLWYAPTSARPTPWESTPAASWMSIGSSFTTVEWNLKCLLLVNRSK